MTFDQDTSPRPRPTRSPRSTASPVSCQPLSPFRRQRVRNTSDRSASKDGDNIEDYVDISFDAPKPCLEPWRLASLKEAANTPLRSGRGFVIPSIFTEELRNVISAQRDVTSLRVRVQDERLALQRKRKNVADHDRLFMDELRRQWIDGAGPNLDSLETLYSQSAEARDRIGPAETDYDDLEMRLGHLEFKLAKDTENLWAKVERGPENADDANPYRGSEESSIAFETNSDDEMEHDLGESLQDGHEDCPKPLFPESPECVKAESGASFKAYDQKLNIHTQNEAIVPDEVSLDALSSMTRNSACAFLASWSEGDADHLLSLEERIQKFFADEASTIAPFSLEVDQLLSKSTRPQVSGYLHGPSSRDSASRVNEWIRDNLRNSRMERLRLRLAAIHAGEKLLRRATRSDDVLCSHSRAMLSNTVQATRRPRTKSVHVQRPHAE
ncbi:hypothetical protein BDY21DRAFT_354759 [Lineolata rhizophorae]|uniref:Uncharacterized protein n=1 Tax=Lineolata rhizophorae TaxID=578093 RepID=A0A6A6NRE8_9PEZI|nr:hypothetical protein BDY21DRAFT_354759 [Lineolata rhizophorae]